MRRLDWERRVSLNAVGTERRKSTSIESGIERADMMVLDVAVCKPRLVARASSSW